MVFRIQKDVRVISFLCHVLIRGAIDYPIDQCGDDGGGYSRVYSFKTPVPVGSEMPQLFGIIGDLGYVEVIVELTL